MYNNEYSPSGIGKPVEPAILFADLTSTSPNRMLHDRTRKENVFFLDRGDYYSVEWGDQTSPTLFFLSQDTEEELNDESIALQKNSELISDIRDSFSLRVSELAKVLNTSRQTVYFWLNKEKLPQKSSRARIELIAEILLEWKQLSKRPLGELVRQPMTSTKSLLQLLSETNLERRKIKQLMSECAEQLEMKLKSGNPQTIREKWKARGIDTTINTSHKDDVDIIGGKRLESE